MASNRETQALCLKIRKNLSLYFSRGNFIALSEGDDRIVPVEIPTP